MVPPLAQRYPGVEGTSRGLGVVLSQGRLSQGCRRGCALREGTHVGWEGRGRGRSPLTCGPGSAFTPEAGELGTRIAWRGSPAHPCPSGCERAGGLVPLVTAGTSRWEEGSECWAVKRRSGVRVQLPTGGALGVRVGCWVPCPAPLPLLGVWLLNSSSLRVWRNC